MTARPRPCLAFIGLIGLIASFFTIIYAYGRNTYSLSRAGYFPQILSITHPTRHTPYVALIAGAVVGYILSLVIYLLGQSESAVAGKIVGALLYMAVFGAVISYFMQCLAFIMLRRRLPNIERPYRSPVGIPGAAIAGVIALVALVSLFLNPDYRPGVVGTLVYFLLGVAYFAIAGRHKLVLSPEEEFAMTQGKYGVNLEEEGYGAVSVTDIKTDDQRLLPKPEGTSCLSFWESTSARRASRPSSSMRAATSWPPVRQRCAWSRARRLGGPGPVHLLHRAARRRPQGDRQRRHLAGHGDGPGQPGRRRRRLRCRRRTVAAGDHLARQARHRAVRPTGRRGGARGVGGADGPGGRCLAQRAEDDVDPRARARGLAAGGDAGAGRVVSAAPPHRCPRAGRRECVVDDGVRRHPQRFRRRPMCRSGFRPRDAAAGPSVHGGGRDTAARCRRRTRAARTVRRRRRHRGRTRRVGRCRRHRGRRRRRRHRYRRAGDDRIRRTGTRPAAASWRPTAMRCPARG